MRERDYFWSKTQLGIMNPLDSFPSGNPTTSGPFSGGLPHIIDVGEDFAVYFLHQYQEYFDKHVFDMGFSDTFGRNHWAKRSQMKQIQNAILKLKPAQKDQ